MTIMPSAAAPRLETKFIAFDPAADLGDGRIAGYASLFDVVDGCGDEVAPGAFAASLRRAERRPKLLWQHDPARPIGVWDALREDERGLHASGRLLTEIQSGAEAAVLLRAGAVDGLSIGYRAVRAARSEAGGRRLLEIDLWEISLVTFPMLPEARAAVPAAEKDDAPDLVAALRAARALFD